MYTYTIVSKFHETVDCIKTKLKIVTSMQFKLCTASWLEWGGGTQYKSVYRGVPQTWVAKSRWSGLSVGPFFCKTWCQKSQNLCQKSINFHKNCRHENFQEKAGIPAFWSEFMQFSFLFTRFWAFWQDFLFFVKSHSHAWNCDFCIIWVKIWAIGMWIGPLLVGGIKIPCSTSLCRPNLGSQANPCYQAFIINW